MCRIVLKNTAIKYSLEEYQLPDMHQRPCKVKCDKFETMKPTWIHRRKAKYIDIQEIQEKVK